MQRLNRRRKDNFYKNVIVVLHENTVRFRLLAPVDLPRSYKDFSCSIPGAAMKMT